MPSAIDRIDPDTLDHELELGAVIPIERHLSIARGLWSLGDGGSLYLVAAVADATWLVAILEAPEQSQIRPRDRRARGWYAPANVTPITDITGKLTLGKRVPRRLTDKEEALLRELIDDTDAPLIDSGARDSSPAINPEGTPLERAVAYLAGNDPRSGLGAMLDAWRETRAVELADLIDRTSRVLPAFERPLAVERDDDAAIAKAWDQAFTKDPSSAMSQLLQYVNVGSDIVDRWTRLAALPPDPRIARRIAARLADLLGDESLAILEHTRDATAWTEAAQLAAEIHISVARDDEDDDGYVGYDTVSLAESGQMAFTRKKSPAGKLAKSAQQLIPTIEAQLERLEAPRRMECDLVDAIADDWKSDAPRSIYADWLIERGHPRGEYLSLILRGEKKLTAPQRRRFALLSNVPYLYGMLDEIAVMQRRVRDRGIDRSLDVYWSTSPLMWRAAMHNPLIRALTQIRLVGELRDHRIEALAAFLAAAPRVAIIEDVDARDAKKLVGLGRGWRHDAGKQQLLR